MRSVVLLMVGVVVLGCGGAESGAPVKVEPRSSKCPVDVVPVVRLDGSLPEKLKRYDVQSSMNRVAGEVAACKPTQGGTVTVGYKVAPSGQVIFAEPVGSRARSEIGYCAADAVCQAIFPPAKHSISVKYPFKLGLKHGTGGRSDYAKCQPNGVVTDTGPIAGELTELTVDQVFYAHLDELLCCASQARRGKNVSHLELSVVVNADGSTSATANNFCAEQLVESLRFPSTKDHRGVWFEYKLHAKWDENGKGRIAKEGMPFDWRPGE